MRQTAAYAIAQAQALMGDPKGQFATQDRLLPLLQHAQDMMILNIFRNETVQGIEGIVVVPGVAAQTTSLGPWLEAGRELANLTSIIVMRERPTGQTEDMWTGMAPVLGDLPPVQSSAQMLNLVFKWLGTDLLLPGSSQAEDFRVYGSFAPAALTGLASVLIPGTEGIMAARAAALLTRPRNRQMYLDLEGEARQLEDELFTSLCREKQDVDIHQVANSGYPNQPFYI